MSEYKTLLVEDRGAVRLVTLNQPKIFNPLDDTSGPELIKCLEGADREPAVRAVVLTGAGRAFSGGGNVRLMARILEEGLSPAAFFADLAGVLNRSIITLRRMSKPVVCALNGVASGGGLGWCLGCDLVIAARSARFDPGYIRIAVNPDGGSTALVTRLIGHKRASAFFMLGRVIEMDQALAWGMVNEVVDDGREVARAVEVAQELARGPAEALAATKELLNRAVLGDLETVMEDERFRLMELCERPDFAEGIRAFFEKRPPRFS